MSKEPNAQKMLIERKPAVSKRILGRRCRTAWIDRVVPVDSLTPLPSRTKKKTAFWQKFPGILVSFHKGESFSEQRCKFQRRNNSLAKKKSETGERIFRIDLAPGERKPLTFDRDVSTVDFGGVQHTFLPNGLPSSRFILAQVWFRLFTVSSSSFQEISDNLVILFMQQPKSSEESKNWCRMCNWLWRRRKMQEEDKYQKNYTRLYPTLPTQVVMLYHPWRIHSGSSRAWELWNRSSVMEKVVFTVLTASARDQGASACRMGSLRNQSIAQLWTRFQGFLRQFEVGKNLDGI